MVSTEEVNECERTRNQAQPGLLQTQPQKNVPFSVFPQNCINIYLLIFKNNLKFET